MQILWKETTHELVILNKNSDDNLIIQSADNGRCFFVWYSRYSPSFLKTKDILYAQFPEFESYFKLFF